MTFKDRAVSVNTNPQWLSLLGCIFVLLKVFDVSMVATWSWWLVLLPFYVGIAFLGAFLAILGAGALACGAVVGLAGLYDAFQRNRRRARFEKGLKK